MVKRFTEEGFDKPPRRRAAEFDAKLKSHPKWKRALRDRRLEDILAARLRRAPGPVGMRTEISRPQYYRNPDPWCYIAEAVSQNVVPPKIRAILSTVATAQLIKKDKQGRYTINCPTRPIGKSDRLLADFLRGEVSAETKALGRYLKKFGQMAVSITSGTEGVSTALQTRCDNDHYVITIFTDASNAYCRLDPVQIELAIQEALRDIRESTDDELKTFGLERRSITTALNKLSADLIFLRTYDGYATSTVDGKLVRFRVPGGAIQGGMRSMPQYCITVAMLVIRELQRKYPSVRALSIADDLTVQVTVKNREDLKLLPEWFSLHNKLFQLMGGKNNFGKFKILQHPVHAGTDIDVAQVLHLFPRDETTGDGPEILRTAHTVNGVGVGFDMDARQMIALVPAKTLRNRSRILQHYMPTLGKQRVYALAVSSYRPAATLNHLMRNTHPDAARPALMHAGETAVGLMRMLTNASEKEIPSRHFDVAGGLHPASGVVESMHLGYAQGGCG